MRSYVILFSLAFLLALGLTPVVRRWARRWGALAIPDQERRHHAQATPQLGGIAIFLAFALTLCAVPWLGNLVSQQFRTDLPRLLNLLVPAALIFALGVYDDFRNASAPLKFGVQVLTAVAVFAAGYQINVISVPGGFFQLPVLLNLPLTILWIVGITNAFNLIDGIDGLAAGASVFALVSILIFSVVQGNPAISVLSVILIGAVTGSLRYNFNPATIFLGDSGALFLGFMAAVLSLAGSQKGTTLIAIAIPLVSFGLPVIEVGLSLIRRFLSGQALFAGDRGHIHHMLLQRGWSQRQAVILLYGVCALFTLFGLLLLNPKRELAALIFFVLGIGIVFGVQHLRYAEFTELGNQIKQGVTRRRRALAVNVKVRRASVDLSQVQTSDQMFAALNELLSTGEFDRIALAVRQDLPLVPSGTTPLSLLYSIHLPRNEEPFEQQPEHIVIWAWESDAACFLGAQEMQNCWELRVPLITAQAELLGALIFYRRLHDSQAPAVDIQHLCGELQRELSAALARVVASRPSVATIS